MANTKARYGKEIVGKRVKIQAADGKKWRNATVSGYHGGYLRHTVTFDDNDESRQVHLYQEEYKFMSEEGAGPMPDLLQRTISVQSPMGGKVTGEVIHYDGLMHTVRLSDGSTQHFNLRQQTYKQEQSSRSSRRGSEGPAAPPAGTQEGAGTSGGKKQKQQQQQQTSHSANSAGGSGNSKAAAAAAQGNARKTQAAADSKADGSSKPPRRAAADRAAAVAVAVSMGGNGGVIGRDEDKVARRPTGATPKSASGGALSVGAARRGGDAPVVEPAKKLPPLNMSHVSKKDREAARMLLTFSTPTAQEAQATTQPFSESHKNGSVVQEAASSRTAIAAMAQAAAAAAGLPDPAAVEEVDEPLSPMQIDDTLGDGPALALAAAAAAAAIAGAEEAEAEAAAAGNGDSASPTGEGDTTTAIVPVTAEGAVVAVPAPGDVAAVAGAANGAGGSLDGMLVTQVLTSLQRQMQKLITLEERRSVDIVRLNAKVARLQDERDDSFREKEAALAERETLQVQVQELQEDNNTLSTRVELLQREVLQLQAHIRREHDMVGSLSMDAAALQMQLAGIRNELGCCKAESSQLLSHFRVMTGVESSDAGAAAFDSNATDAAAAAAVMMSLSGGADLSGKDRQSKGPYGHKLNKVRLPHTAMSAGAAGAGAGAGVIPELDPAAAAALPVPAEQLGRQASSSLRPIMQPLMPFKAMTEARTLGVGQLMQVGPGKLVVGPRGWKPPPVQPPPAPPPPKQHGGRHKRKRGHAAKLAAQRKREAAAAAAAAAAEEGAGDGAAAAAATAEGAAAAAAAAEGATEDDEHEHEDADMADAGGDEQSDEEEEGDRERSIDAPQQKKQKQQGGDSGSGSEGAGGKGSGSEPVSRDATPAAADKGIPAAAAAAASRGQAGQPGSQGAATTAQQQHGAGHATAKAALQQQQQQPGEDAQEASRDTANGSTRSRSSSPTPDKRQQTDQDSSNANQANKKRKRDEPKASVLADGSSGAPATLTASQMLAARVAAAAAAAAAQPAAAAHVPASGMTQLRPGGFMQLKPQPQQQQQQAVAHRTATPMQGGTTLFQGGTTFVMRPAAPKPTAAAGAATTQAAPVPGPISRPPPAAAVPANIAREALQAAKRLKSEAERSGSLPLQQQGNTATATQG